MSQPLGFTNQPVPVSRNAGGVTFVSPSGQRSVTAAATSDTTRAVAGVARRSTSWIVTSEADPVAGSSARRTARKACNIVLHSIRCYGVARLKERGLQGRSPEALVVGPKIAFLLQRRDSGLGLRLRRLHVTGLARRLRLLDQRGSFADAPGGRGPSHRARGLHILAARGLHILAARGLHILAAQVGRAHV